MAKPTNPFVRGADRPAPFLPVGHRGARALAPENTLPSFALAAELGALMVEFDVCLSRDGVPMVHHDATLERTTDAATRHPDRAPWRVQAFDMAELVALDAGAWFADTLPFGGFASDDERAAYLTTDRLDGYTEVGVPTLEAALVQLADLGLYVNVELKALPRRDKGLAAAVLQVIERLGHGHRVVLSSFDHALVRELKRAAPHVAVAVLTADRLAEPVRYLVDVVGADGLNPLAGPVYDSLGADEAPPGEVDELAERVAALRDAGLLVLPWTVNDPARIRRLAAVGVDGVIGDFPNRLSGVRAGGTSPTSVTPCPRSST